MKIELNAWLTPNYVTAKMPPRKREDGFNSDNAPKWALKDVDAETLSEQCDNFRAEIFSKAGKKDPIKKI